MKALVKKERKPGLWLEEVPHPRVGINDVLIRVDRTGIRGTDLHIYNGTLGATHHPGADGRRP
jgi:threonine 3-dehydrogenase